MVLHVISGKKINKLNKKKEVLAADRIRLAVIVFTLGAEKQHRAGSRLISTEERARLKM